MSSLIEQNIWECFYSIIQVTMIGREKECWLALFVSFLIQFLCSYLSKSVIFSQNDYTEVAWTYCRTLESGGRRHKGSFYSSKRVILKSFILHLFFLKSYVITAFPALLLSYTCRNSRPVVSMIKANVNWLYILSKLLKVNVK